MLYESSHVRVSADDGIATLEFGFPGPPANPLSVSRLRDIGRGLDAVRAVPAIEVVVVRSGSPHGFCGGFHPPALSGLRTDADAAAFAAEGQRVLSRLADSPVVSVAFVEGPCVGPGFELALACDYRLAVAGPDSRFAFGPTPTCWGGRTRFAMRNGSRGVARFDSRPPTARQLVTLGGLDDAFCERRAKIDLRTWLDRLRRHPRKRPRISEHPGFADERRTFRAAVRAGLVPPEPADLDAANPVQPIRQIGLVGDGRQLHHLAGEFACRGVRVLWAGAATPADLFRVAVRTGRMTPLEAEQATARVSLHTDADAATTADLVVLDDSACGAAGHIERELPPRAVLAVPVSALRRTVQLASRPGRVVGLAVDRTVRLVARDETSPDALAAAVSWLGMVGDPPAVVRQTRPSSPRLLVAQSSHE